MSRDKTEHKPDGATESTESLFTITAIKLGLLFFPSMSTQKERNQSRALREELIECHKRTLELQQEMDEYLKNSTSTGQKLK